MESRRPVGGLIALALLALSIALPLYFALIASLTPEVKLFEAPSLVPRAPTLAHYRALFAERHFLVPIRNSLVVAGATTAACLALGSLCAYALARLSFFGRGAVLALVLAVSMFPQVCVISPLYLALRRLHLIDSYPGLVLPYLTFALPLAVWLLTSYFRQIPAALEEAALVDGATRLQALIHVVLPVALPGLAATAVLTFVYCWNEFLFALSFTVGPERQTVPVAIALLRGRYQVPWGQILAASVVAAAPVAALVLLFQRWIVSGLTGGALKE